MTNPSGQPQPAPSGTQSPHAWPRLALLAALFLLVHWPAFAINAQVARESPDWGHVYLVPFISLYLVWQQWGEIRKTPVRTFWWGAPLLAAGLYMYLLLLELGRATPLAYFTIFNAGVLILFLGGPKLARRLAIPVAYLLFAVPNDLLLQPVSSKLQMLAAGGADVLINAAGLFLDLQADRLGATIQICHRGIPVGAGLEIAQACSGLRMLMAFAALGTAMAYLMREKPRWIRVTLMLSTVPIAVAANILRITGMGLAYPWFPGVASGDLHGLLGLLMLLPAVGLFFLLEWILVRLWIPAGDGRRKGGPRTP